MKVREFHIQGFRSLKNTSVSGIPSKAIFHGDNDSGKSNLFLALEAIFVSKESAPGIFLDEEEINQNAPRHTTPFWQGQIPNFADNFYMGGDEPVTFDVLLQVAPSFFTNVDEREILTALEETGHDFRVRLKGQISRREDAGVITLNEVEVNGQVAMEHKAGRTEWLPKRTEAADAKQRFVESMLDALTDQVRIVPASRFLAEETFSSKQLALRSQDYKNWLHSMSLSRNGYETFKKIRHWFASKPFGLGEISFVVENDLLELMIEDDCEYRMRIDQKGSGIQQILVLIGYIAESNAAIVAIEEPELNLSFRNQDLIVNILRQLVDDTDESPHQILFSSHSDHIGAREDLERYHVEKTNGTDTVVRHFTPDDRKALFPRTNLPKRRVHIY